MMYNEYEMSITLKRIDVCDLLLACLSAHDTAMDGGKKWMRLHDEIKEQLKRFDEKNA